MHFMVRYSIEFINFFVVSLSSSIETNPSYELLFYFICAEQVAKCNNFFLKKNFYSPYNVRQKREHMSIAAASNTNLAQSLYRVLSQVTEGMDPKALVGEENHKQECKDWIEAAERAVKAAQKKTPELIQIEQFEMALRYRVSLIDTDESEHPVKPLLELLHDKYKAFFPNGIPKEFVSVQLQYLCQKYPAFAQRLLTPATSTDEWSANFIKFAIVAPSQSIYRDVKTTHWVDIFLKYPEVTERLMKSHLHEKLGLYPENIKLIEKKNHGELNGVRQVCLKMDLADKKANKWVPINFVLPFTLKNIAKPSQGLSLTMDEVFKEFEKPCPHFAISEVGIINLNPFLLASKKNHEGVSDLIELHPPLPPPPASPPPPAWLTYKPSMMLSEPQLHAKYGTLPVNFEYGFVLKADRLLSNCASTQSHVSFDYIIRDDDGNYRVFSMDPNEGHDVHLREQKLVFYSLTPAQADAVIKRVTKDIENYRKSNTEGKSTPFINIEPYMDDIFGRDFYDFLIGLASKLKDGDKLKAQLTHAKQTFDPQDFEKFVSPILQKLVMNDRDVPEMQKLIETSLNTLKFLLQINNVTSIAIPNEAAVRSATGRVYNNDQDGKEIYESLLALTRLCFVLLHPYSVKVTDIEKNTPVIGTCFKIIEAIPWKILRDLLSSLLLLALSRFRNYRYKKPEADSPQSTLKNLVGKINDLQPLPYLNEPAQIFETYSPDSLARTVEDITKHYGVLAKTGG